MKNVHYKYLQKWSENNHGSASIEATEGQDDAVDIIDGQDLEIMYKGELIVDVEGPVQSAGDAHKESDIIIDTWLNLKVNFYDVAVHQNSHIDEQIMTTKTRKIGDDLFFASKDTQT
eukprot:11359854-Ditylum_brightwellii.AAC.1